MTSELWAPPPVFVAGQYFSAAAHGNALVQCCDVLMGAYKGAFPVWQTGLAGASGYWHLGWGPTSDGNRIWSGAVRHKAAGDTLVYSVRVWKSGATKTLKVKIPGTTKTHTIAAGSGYTDVTVTAATGIDVSGLTADTFYEVHFDLDVTSGALEAQVLYCHETDEQTYAALAGFTAGTVYTAGQWQALSDRATALWQQQSDPTIALCGSYHSSDGSLAESVIGRWMMCWKNRYLAYQVFVRGGNPRMTTIANIYVDGVFKVGVGQVVLSHEIDDSQTTINFGNTSNAGGIFLSPGMVVKINSELILLGATNPGGDFTSCTRGYRNTTPAAHKNEGHIWQEDQDGKTYDPLASYHMYRGVISLDEAGLTEGQLVEVTAELVNQGGENEDSDDSAVMVDYLYQTSASSPYIPGWSAMPSFSHRSTVGGAGSVKTIRDNLTWLSAVPSGATDKRITYRNPATPNLSRWGGWGVRQKRWLIYYCGDPEAQPELTYWKTNKGKEIVGLSNEPNKWLCYDLGAADGLWDGVAYRVTGVTFALEDEVSV